MTRAARRHHHARMIVRTRRFLAVWGDRYSDAYICRRAENRKPCSCMLCGNPRRRWGEITMQERKAPTAEDWA